MARPASQQGGRVGARCFIFAMLSVAAVVQLVSVAWAHRRPSMSSHPTTTASLRRVETPPPRAEEDNKNPVVARVAVPDTPRKTVAYAVSVTKDGSYIDGAAVLAHSVIRQHRQGKSRYDAELVAFVAPAVSVQGRSELEALGYRVLQRPLPVEVEDIQGNYLRSKIGNNGCCGAWELLKLYSWQLTEYHRVVHLDMDVLVLQNIDELYDDDNYWADPKTRALYTYDWTMSTPPWGEKAPVQGGFIVAKPDLETYAALVDVVRVGDFREGSGWGGTHVGKFWGGMTIQGLVPYFFEHHQPGTGKAVDGCVYNNMATNPKSIGGFGKGVCRDGTPPPESNCDDCRLKDAEEIKTTHFTICQKPWTCSSGQGICPYCPLCAKLHTKWFEIREEMEREWGTYSPEAYSGNAQDRHGMCGRHADGTKGYRPVPITGLIQNEANHKTWLASWKTTR